MDEGNDYALIWGMKINEAKLKVGIDLTDEK